MAYNFLGLVNDINEKMNEVALTSSNFASATGFYSDAKTSVNTALNKINTYQFEWPFNHQTKSLVLTVDQVRYDYEATAKSVAYNTFRIQGSNSLGNNTIKLGVIDYEEYLEFYSDMEYRPEDHHGKPRIVFRTPSNEFGVIPPPDLAYTLDYEYYALPTPLEDWDDVPTVPEVYRYVIRNGSLSEAFAFRGDAELSELYRQKFKEGVEEMRTIYINRTEYARSTMRF